MTKSVRLNQRMRDAFVKAVLDDVPSKDYQEMRQKIVTEEAVSQLPLKIRALWEDKKLREYVATDNQHYANKYYYRIPGHYKPTQETLDKLRELEAAEKAQDKQRQELRDKLRAVALAVNTRKELVAALPEFEKYMPEAPEDTSRMLPCVANVVTDFVKAGWPKDRKAA